jgi:hypothetical protein
MQSASQCTSCQWIRSPNEVTGGLLWVGKFRRWTVNHYGSDQAILGWLALQPVEHKLTLDELSGETLDDLGSALGSVQRAMRKVWRQKFPNDSLERIHTVSFMESHFDEHKPTQQSKSFFHAHIFLIPRSESLGKVIRRELKTAPGIKQYVPWDDYLIYKRIKDRSAQGLLEKNIPWDVLGKYIKGTGNTKEKAWKKEKEDFMRRLQQELRRTIGCTL